MSSKIAKIGLYLFGSIFLLLFTALAVIRTQWFQSRAVKYAAAWFSEELQTQVQVGGIDVKFPDALVLKDLIIFDRLNDTMIATSELRVRLASFDRENAKVRFRSVYFENPVFQLIRRTDGFNYNFLIDYFTPEHPDPDAPDNVIMAGRVLLNNGLFHYQDLTYETSDYGPFKDNNILIRRINGELNHFYLEGDSLHFGIKALSACEQSGICIRRLEAQMTISDRMMEFNKLYLATDESVVRDYLRFDYENYNQMADFIDSVDIRANFRRSAVSLTDLSAFSHDLKGYHDVFKVHGELSGKVNLLRARNMEMSSERFGSFRGKFRLRGLPDWESTYASITCDPLELSYGQLAFLAGSDALPSEMSKLGTLRYEGDFQGFYNDFVALGQLETALGTLESNVNLKMKSGETPVYKGELASQGFDFGRLYSLADLGKSSFDVQLEGQGFELDQFEAKLKGQIRTLNFHNYNYRDIVLEGELENRFFRGKMETNDPNLKMMFGGTIDLQSEQPYYDFKAEIQEANLQALKWDDQESSFSGIINIQLNGKGLDDMFGISRIQEIEVIRNRKRYAFEDVVLISEIAGFERDIYLKSEFADLHINGNFKLGKAGNVWRELRASLLPDYYLMPSEQTDSFKMTLTASINKAEKITDLLDLPITLSTGQINGAYNSLGKELRLDLALNEFAYEQTRLQDLRLKVGRNEGEPLHFEEYSAQIFLGNRLFSQTSSLKGNLGGNRSDFTLQLNDSSSGFSLGLTANTSFLNDSIVLQITNGSIEMDSARWQVEGENSLVWHNGTAYLSGFELRSGKQFLKLDGKVSSEEQQSALMLRDFDLSMLNRFMNDTSLVFGGHASGLLSTGKTFAHPLIYSDLLIEDFQFHSDTLGDVRLIANTINPQKPFEMSVSASVQEGLLKEVELNGTINASPGANSIDMELIWNDGQIKPLERFTEGIISGLTGTVKARARVSGKLDDPRIKGSAMLSNASFLVDYLGVRYHFDHQIEFTEKEFSFKRVKVLDDQGQSAYLSGWMKHRMFNEMTYDLNIEDARNLKVLETGKGDNELFYGKAYADGSCRITGDLYDVDFKIKAKSRPGTQLFVPLEYSEENVTAGFIRFTAFQADAPLNMEVADSREGTYTMDFNLELSRDAEVWMIFDEQLGDIIKGNGNGNLKMEVNSEGDFYMYGNYTIESGSYQYTALNFFSKEFAIDKGSALVWDGDPYQARMDITATKREQAAPYDLMVAYTSDQALLEQMRNKVPVDCKLMLTGLLFNPEIKFNFEVVNAGTSANNAATAQFNTILQQIKTDPDEVNRQVFSLLVLGTFLPPTFGQGVGNTSAVTGVQNTYRNSVSDLISNQLSNWFSQLDPKWQVGVNWQAAGEETARELIVSVRRKFLNERLEFAGSVDAGSSYNYTPYNLNLRYNISTDGRFMVHGFTRQVNDPTLGNITNITTTGVGLYYRKEFDRISLRRRKQETPE